MMDYNLLSVIGISCSHPSDLKKVSEKIQRELQKVMWCAVCLGKENNPFCVQEKMQKDKCGEIVALLQSDKEIDIEIGIILGKILLYTKLVARRMPMRKEFGEEGKVEAGDISLKEYQNILRILSNLLRNQEITDYIFSDEAKTKTFMYTVVSFFRVTSLFSAYSFEANNITKLLLFHMANGTEFGKKKTLEGYLRWINDMLDYTNERSKVAPENAMSEEIFFFSHRVLFGKYTKNIDDLCSSILKYDIQHTKQYGIFLTNFATWLYYVKGNKDGGYSIAQKARSIKKELHQTSNESFAGIEAIGILLDYYVKEKAYNQAVELIFEIPFENLQQKTGPVLGFIEQFCTSWSSLSVPFFQKFLSFEEEKKERFFHFIQHLFGLDFTPENLTQVNEIVHQEHERNGKRKLQEQEILRLMRDADEKKEAFFLVVNYNGTFIPFIQNAYGANIIRYLVDRGKNSNDFFCGPLTDKMEFTFNFSKCSCDQKKISTDIIENHFPGMENGKYITSLRNIYTFLEACGKNGLVVSVFYNIHYFDEKGRFVAKKAKVFPSFISSNFIGIGIVNEDVTEYVSLLENLSGQIAYAKKLISSLLKHYDTVLKEYFQDKFLLHFQPKDTIGGDFYRTKEVVVDGKKQILMAVGDCTGHGVPGAILSVLGINILNQITDSNCYKPDEVLREVNKKFFLELNAKNDWFLTGRVNDGIDMGIFLLDVEGKVMQFAGANRPLWILRNGEITEYTPTKVSIGTKYAQEYSLHVINLQPGDVICMFSDGITHQFGREEKKLGKKGLQTFLVDLLQKGKTMEDMKKEFEEFLKEWMGPNEQIDDIILFLLKVE